MSQLDDVLKQLEKNFGHGAVQKLGGDAKPVEAISTGSIGLDHALGIGGLPRGRVVEIFGPPSSGKSTLTLHVVANAQKMGGKAAIIDSEHALDPTYAANLGVDVDELLVCQPDYGEQGLEIARALVKSGELAVLVIDSVAALVPRSEIEGDVGDAKVGLHARLMSQAMRMLTPALGATNTLCIVVNQLRDKIGVIYGSPEVTTGGKAIPFYASVRIDVRKAELIKDGNDAVANKTKFKVVKNKMAPPFKTAEADIIFGEGISRYGELVDLGVSTGIITQRGSWFSLDGEQVGQGRKSVIEALKANADMADSIEVRIRECLK